MSGNRASTLLVKFEGKTDPSLAKAAGDAEGTVKRSSTTMMAVASGIGTAVGGLVGRGLRAAGDAALDFFSGSIDASSDLAESLNVTTLVFGKQADAMEGFFKSSAAAVGMSESATREASANIGGLLQNMKFSNTESAKWSETLIKLGADMGSAFNADPSDAIAALGAGLRGDSESLKRFNVFLNDTAVKQKAVSLGLYSGKGALSDNAAAQARLALVMEQTSKIQGDFVNTSEGQANASRVQAANIENLKAKVGQGLLPVMEAGLGLLNGWVPVLGTMADGITGLADVIIKGDFTSKFAEAFGVEEDYPIVAFLFSARDAAIAVGERVGEMAGRIGAALSGEEVDPYESPLGQGLTWLADDVIPQATGAVMGFLDSVEGMASWMRDNADVVGPLAVGIGVLVAGMWAMNAVQAVVAAGGLLSWLTTVAKSTTLYTAAQWLLNIALSANPIGLVIIALTALGVGLAIAWNKSETFRNVVTGAWAGVKVAVSGVVDWFTRVAAPMIDGFLGGLSRGFDGFVRGLGNWATNLKNAITAPIRWVTDHVINPLLAGIEKVAGVFGQKLSLPRVQLAQGGIVGGNGPKGGRLAFHDGGMMPGYTPGRDVHRFWSPTGGLLELSGGEPVLRPEWGAVLGGGMIERMNAAARAGGTAGVRAFLGGGMPVQRHANGGIIGDTLSKLGSGSLPGLDPIGWLKEQAGKFGGPILSQLGDSAIARMLSGVPAKIGEWASKKLLDLFGALAPGGKFTPGNWPVARMGAVSPNTAAAVNFVRKTWGIANIGTLGARPNKSDHPMGKALDVMIPQWQGSGIPTGNAIASWFVSNPGVFGTKMVIWRDQVNRGAGWRPYTHPLGPTKNPTLRHMDHVHVSVYDDGGWLMPGEAAVNRSSRPEPVFSGGQWDDLRRVVATTSDRGEDLGELVELMRALLRKTMGEDEWERVMRDLRRPAPKPLEVY